MDPYNLVTTNPPAFVPVTAVAPKEGRGVTGELAQARATATWRQWGRNQGDFYGDFMVILW